MGGAAELQLSNLQLTLYREYWEIDAHIPRRLEIIFDFSDSPNLETRNQLALVHPYVIVGVNVVVVVALPFCVQVVTLDL